MKGSFNCWQRKGPTSRRRITTDERPCTVRLGEVPRQWSGSYSRMGLGSHVKDEYGKRALPVPRRLVDKWAYVNAKDNYGRTSLHWVAEQGHKTVVQMLVDKGPSIDARDNDRQIGRASCRERV